eukprot:4043098-Pleurochrysis_carterae.AAC.1
MKVLFMTIGHDEDDDRRQRGRRRGDGDGDGVDADGDAECGWRAHLEGLAHVGGHVLVVAH